MATSIVKGVIGNNAAKKAASQQAAANEAAANEARSQFAESQKNLNTAAGSARGDITSARDTSLGYLNPFLQTGTSANTQLGYGLGLNDTDLAGGLAGTKGGLTKSFTMADYEADPGYKFRLEEGQKALARAQGAAGKYFSGAGLRGLTDYNQKSASQEYQNAYDRYNTNQTNLYNRLAGVSNSGQSAAGTMAGISSDAGNSLAGVTQDTANNIANLGAGKALAVGSGLTGAGNARAMGALGSGQAWITGINSLEDKANRAAGLAAGMYGNGGGSSW